MTQTNNSQNEYITPAAAAKLVRAELKAAGFNRNAVSVRSESYSMGSSIRIQIKDPALTVEVAKAAGEKFQNISRCNLTGEILSGGNRFVFVYNIDGYLA